MMRQLDEAMTLIREIVSLLREIRDEVKHARG